MAKTESTSAASRWYRRPGILIAAAALTAEVGIAVSGFGEIGGTPVATESSSTSFSLVTTEWWEPTPEPPPPPPPAPEPVVQAPAPAPRRVVVEPPAPPPPPPPPPPELVLRLDEPVTGAFISIRNNPGPPVGCTMHTAPLSGPAAMVNFAVPDNHFTVSGAGETRVPAGSSTGGPATGTNWRLTVTCDNGLTTSVDKLY